MTFGSLFAGIGGFDLGFERAGLACAWQVEISQFCQKVLQRHWPIVRRHDDVRTFPPTDPANWSCDVICGGFPCKQTSTAAAVHGRRSGLAGTDSGLWFDMLRVVRLVRPSWVVVENVAGASSYGHSIKTGLEDAGYHVPREPLSMSALDVGAPHLRRRLFWIANRNKQGLALTGASRPQEITGQPGRAAGRDAWLSHLARTVRVDDGFSGGLERRERITAIGNAVVPHMAFCIGKWLIEQQRNEE